MDGQLETIRTRIRSAQNLVIHLGAGLGVEYASDQEDGGSLDDSVVTNAPEVMATPDTFRRDPARLWRWYLWRRERIARAAVPAWVETISRFRGAGRTVSVITENVDGVLDGVGLELLELHGNLWRTRCLGCNRVRTQRSIYSDSLPPKCDHCLGLLRPDVVLFGETLDSKTIDRAMRLACSTDVLLVAGTQGLVATSATMVTLAAENGVYVVDIDEEYVRQSNPEQVNASLRGACESLLMSLLG